MTTTYRKPHRARRWFHRNSVTLFLLGIILLSMTVGAVGCYAILSMREETPKETQTEAPEVTHALTEEIIQPTPTMPTIIETPVEEPFYFNVPLTHEIQDYIRETSERYGVPMELVIAVIDKESSFRANVISGTNDYGYMQINTINFETLTEKLGVTDLLDPYENILSGIYLLSGHLERTDGDIELVLMRYNCGATGAKRLWDKGIYSTEYTSRIMALYESYLNQSKEN